MEITIGGLSQLLVTMCILVGSIYLVAEGEMNITQLMEIWGMLGLGMGIGFINGKKAASKKPKP